MDKRRRAFLVKNPDTGCFERGPLKNQGGDRNDPKVWEHINAAEHAYPTHVRNNVTVVVDNIVDTVPATALRLGICAETFRKWMSLGHDPQEIANQLRN